MPYDNEWLAICICLVLQVTCTLSNTDTKNNQVYDYGERLKAILPEEIPLLPEAANSFLQRRTLVTSKSKKLYSKVRTRYDKKNEKNSNEKKYNIISPLVDNTYGELKFTSYSAKDFVKKSDITTGLDVVAVKRTIKIGSQVCGSVKEADHNDARWDDKRHIDSDEEKKAPAEYTDILKLVHGCCGDHSKCPRSVPAKTTKFGFTNDIEYAIMSCKCDGAFRKCLKDVKAYTADAIGHLYFDALKIPCLTFYGDTNDSSSHRNFDMISVVPDVSIAHPKIGGAQVILKPGEGNPQTKELDDKKDYFYTHEQAGIADSKEKGRKSSRPQLVKSVQYPTPKMPSIPPMNADSKETIVKG